MTISERPYWENCLTHSNHSDPNVGEFISDYFSEPSRKCFLVAGAGFDPRSRRAAEMLASVMGGRLCALLIREDRPDPNASLLAMADDNEEELAKVISTSSVSHVPVFAEDGAPVGARHVIAAMQDCDLKKGATDIVLDLSALSIGIGFPLARFLLDFCEENGVNLHAMLTSNPELDAQIIGEPSDRAINVRGFAGEGALKSKLPVVRIWLPQLAHRQASMLDRIRVEIGDVYKICPILPFPARNPRRADELIEEFETQLTEEWEVDARDLIYVSEHNPLDSYRTVSTLYKRYVETVKDIYEPQMILSPLGSRVIAIGAFMAATEHGLTIKYVETLRYEYDPTKTSAPDEAQNMMVHLWLHGSVYDNYGAK